MICKGCGHDRPQYRFRLLAFLRAGWPPIEFAMLCRDCRHDLNGGLPNRVLAWLCCAAFLATVGVAGFGIVSLVLWITRHASTS